MFRTPFRLRLAAALLLCATGSQAAPPRVVDDAAGLRALVATERARPRAARIERAAFLAKPMLLGARLSPEGRQVAALVEDGRDRSLWLADAAHPAGHRLLARTPATDMAYSHDGRWLFLASAGQVDALAMA